MPPKASTSAKGKAKTTASSSKGSKKVTKKATKTEAKKTASSSSSTKKKKPVKVSDLASEAWRKKQASKPKAKSRGQEPSELVKKMREEERLKKQRKYREERKLRLRLENEAKGIETRDKPLRKKPPATVLQRFSRMMMQTMFCLHREPYANGDGGQAGSASSSADLSQPVGEVFKVCGSTGNVYTVDIGISPSCDCEDAEFNRDICKHVLFVYFRVLGVPEESHVWYQRALVKSELRQIFAQARPDPSAIHPSLSRIYTQTLNKKGKQQKGAKAGDLVDLSEEGDDQATSSIRREPKAGDSCPICYEEFKKDSGQSLWYCSDSCGNALHTTCAQAWARARPEMSKPITCIYCRAPVIITLPDAAGAGKKKSASSSGGGKYTNLAAHTGIVNPQPAPRRGPVWEWVFER